MSQVVSLTTRDNGFDCFTSNGEFISYDLIEGRLRRKLNAYRFYLNDGFFISDIDIDKIHSMCVLSFSISFGTYKTIKRIAFSL